MSFIKFLQEKREQEDEVFFSSIDETREELDSFIAEGVALFEVEQEKLDEAEYQGKKVELRKPFRDSEGSKKFGVYVKNDKGNVIKVSFGSDDMEIKRDDPEARKSFRARHKCDTANDETTARYWSCKFWQKGKSVSDMLDK